jgi:hypothetical protein
MTSVIIVKALLEFAPLRTAFWHGFAQDGSDDCWMRVLFEIRATRRLPQFQSVPGSLDSTFELYRRLLGL